MMKKLVSLLLALVMALGLCSSALATGIGQEDDKGATSRKVVPSGRKVRFISNSMRMESITTARGSTRGQV